MRKDVRLGLAVGLILIVVVLAYIVFFAGTEEADNTPQTNQQPVIDEPPTILPPQPRQEIAINATTAPAQNISDLLAGISATQPVISATTQPVPANRSWSYLVEHGLDNSADRAGTNTTSPVGPVPAAANAPRTHVVQPGESYWSIAKAEYGDPTFWSHLARANPGIEANRLKAGMTINVPPREQVVGAAASSPAIGNSTPAPATIDPARQYRVQAGESLYVISKKLYGRADKVNEIYELNKQLIGPNPSALKPGMLLQLPEPPASSATTPVVPSAGIQ